MADEVGEVELAVRNAARRVGGGDGEAEPDARLQQVDEEEAEEERDEAGADEPGEAAQADAAERAGVAHVRDADDQRREDERRDDHLDQAQEQRGDDTEIARDLLQPGGGGGRAVVDPAVERQADERAEDEADQDVKGQPLGHSDAPEDVRPAKGIVAAPSSAVTFPP